jgi:hypothetical protein
MLHLSDLFGTTQETRKPSSIRRVSNIEVSSVGLIEQQLDVEIKVGREKVKAIIDSGADVNAQWCRTMKIPVKFRGSGRMKAYNGKFFRGPILVANIKYKIHGVFQRQKFKVLEETGDDLIVTRDAMATRNQPKH